MGSSGSLTGDLVPSESHAHANKVAERSARQHSYASGREVSTIRGTINSKSLTSVRLQGIQKLLLLAGQGSSADEGIRCATHHRCQSSNRYVGRVADELKLLVMSKGGLVNAAVDFTASDTVKQTAIIAIS